MSVQAILDASRRGLSGCDIVAFGDYRSLLILRSSQDAHIRRESLDTLCLEAARLFSQLDEIAKTKGAGQPLRTCGSINGSRTMAFTRSTSGDGEFLCVAGTLKDSIQKALDLAQRTLQHIEVTV